VTEAEPLFPWWVIRRVGRADVFAGFDSTAARVFDAWLEFDDACFFSHPEDAARALDACGLDGMLVVVER
jgi:hypothetical protein